MDISVEKCSSPLLGEVRWGRGEIHTEAVVGSKTVITLAFILSLSLGLVGTVCAHGTGKHVMGTASAVEPDRLQVTTKEGKDVTVRLTPDTQFRRTGPGTSKKPQIGDRVAAEVLENEKSLTAVEVRFATPAAKK